MNTSDPAYEDREQSGIKHYALCLYLEAATRILGTSRNFIYVDCCAGPWESKLPGYADTSFGIAIDVFEKALTELASRNKNPSISCLLIEKESDPFAKLDAFAKTKNAPCLKVHARNWDFTERIQDIVNCCSRSGYFPFIFIDPWGWKLVGISQITPLLKRNPGEVLINLMSSFIKRFIKDEKTDLTDLLGEDFPEMRKLSGQELEFEIVRKYCDRVKLVGGYKYVCALPVMSPGSDGFSFYLIYATRHPKGVVVFKDVEHRTERKTHIVRADVQKRTREQRTKALDLFGADVLYHESSYQKLSRENSERAKSSVWQLVQAKKTISYDDCWAEALQMPAVYESDLREWIKDWEEQGLVEIVGKKKINEAPKINSGHSLRLIKQA